MNRRGSKKVGIERWIFNGVVNNLATGAFFVAVTGRFIFKRRMPQIQAVAKFVDYRSGRFIDHRGPGSPVVVGIWFRK